MKDRSNEYMRPYLAGFLLGIVLLLSFYISGRGLGASGAMKAVIMEGARGFSPAVAERNPYFARYLNSPGSPLKSWVFIEVLGVMIGAILSGALMGRLKLKLEHSPNISARTRVYAAVIGGMFFGFGAQLAKGCTSGAALSGMASLSLAGYITMLAIFGSAYLFAWFFRKLWI